VPIRGARVRVLTGASGFSYPAWKGTFYPGNLPASRMLASYAERLAAVEINATFYRMPKPQTLAVWRAAVGPEFCFALKAPQRITHVGRLSEVGDLVAHFYRVAAELGPLLGPVLFQLPPAFRKDLARLRDFLALLPPGGLSAFEFRHVSWFSDDVFETLALQGAALCITDTEEARSPLLATAGFGYLRLRAGVYAKAALRDWGERILAMPWRAAYVFFKHEDEARGPAYALALREVLGEAAPAQLTP